MESRVSRSIRSRLEGGRFENGEHTCVHHEADSVLCVPYCAPSQQQTINSCAHLVLIGFLSAHGDSEKTSFVLSHLVRYTLLLIYSTFFFTPLYGPVLDSMGRPAVRDVLTGEIDYSLLQPQ